MSLQFNSTGKSSHNLEKLAHFYYQAFSPDEFFFVRDEFIPYRYSPIELGLVDRRISNVAPLKRAGNHYLYNCFNSDIQIVLRLNIY